MKRFTPLLKRISERLELPQPEKSRILLEMEADLEDTYEFYSLNGFSEEEAIRKAEEKFSFSDEALSELVYVHQNFFKRFMDKISEHAQTRWERVILLLVLLVISVLGSRTIFTTQFFLQASKFVWPIIGTFFGIIMISVIKFYQFYIKKDHHVKRLHKGLHAILVLGGTNLFLGVFGYIIELYSATRATMYSGLFDVIITVIKHSEDAFFYSVERTMRCASMAMVCTFVTMFTALIWFALINKIKKIEQAEAAFLIEG